MRIFGLTISRTSPSVQDAWADIHSLIERGGTSRPSDTNLIDAYERNPIVFSCVREICEVISGAIIHAPEPYLTLLEQPQPNVSWSDWSTNFVASTLVTGGGYSRLVKLGRMINEIEFVPTSLVTDDNSDGVIRFDGILVYEDEIISMVTRSIGSNNYRHSPLEGCWQDVLVYDAILNYARKLMLKLPQLTAVVQTTENNTNLQRVALGRSLDNVLGTQDRSTAVLPRGCTMTTPGIVTDPSMKEIAMRCEANICSAFNVPPILVGSQVGLSNSPWSNYANARASMYEETVQPIAKRLSQVLSRKFGVEIELEIQEPVIETEEEVPEAVAPEQTNVEETNADSE